MSIKNINSFGLNAKIDTDTMDFQVTQDVNPFLEQAKLERQMSKGKDVGYKKACTIPDSVAIEINFKYGLNIHDPTFMSDSDRVKKVLSIIRSEYPYLMSY